MEIKKVIELEDKTVEFNGTLNSDELSFLVEWALKDLLIRGILRPPETLDNVNVNVNPSLN